MTNTSSRTKGISLLLKDQSFPSFEQSAALSNNLNVIGRCLFSRRLLGRRHKPILNIQLNIDPLQDVGTLLF